MRAVIQRVKSASVSVGAETVSKIGRGALVLVGVSRDDTAEDVRKLATRVSGLKLWSAENDPEDRWRRSVADTGLPVLCVSQFTLLGSTRKNRPDFRHSAAPVPARELYESFLTELRRLHPGGDGAVSDGRFGEMMDVALVNDGPVTMIVDTEPVAREAPDEPGQEGDVAAQ